MLARRIIVVVVALLLAVQVIRNSAVSALAETHPAVAARVWRGHPEVELTVGMTAIGTAARVGKPVGPAVFKIIDDAAAKAPLAPEPFLVRGVQAQLAGNAALAQQAFLAAEWREPRSLPARYFLAEQFFRAGDARRGLSEVAALARLAPNGRASLAPYIAAYAKDRANWPRLRELFRSDPPLENQALTALAADPANADVILALAQGRGTARSPWLPALLTNLVTAGQYGKARAIWAAASGVRLGPGLLLYDPGFTQSAAPPPFNWTLTSSTVGLAERQPGGRLHVIFYGQEDGVLAQQLIALAPGSYRMGMRISGDRALARSLGWSLICEQSRTPLATIGLDSASGREWVFRVPAGCAAQRLELVGASSDVSQQTDVTISGLNLTRDSRS